MARVLLLDVEEILDIFQNGALNILGDLSDEDEVPEMIQGQVKGLSMAGDMLIEYLRSSVKFAPFPK